MRIVQSKIIISHHRAIGSGKRALHSLFLTFSYLRAIVPDAFAAGLLQTASLFCVFSGLSFPLFDYSHGFYSISLTRIQKFQS